VVCGVCVSRPYIHALLIGYTHRMAYRGRKSVVCVCVKPCVSLEREAIRTVVWCVVLCDATVNEPVFVMCDVYDV